MYTDRWRNVEWINASTPAKIKVLSTHHWTGEASALQAIFNIYLFTNCLLSPQSKVSSMTDDQRSHLTLEEKVKGDN